MGVSRVKWYLRQGFCILHESAHRRFLQHRNGRNDNVPGNSSASLQQLVGIRQSLRLQEEQTYPSWKERDGKDRLRRTLGRTKTDGQRVVIVIHELVRHRIKLSHLLANPLRLRSDFRRVLREERGELRFFVSRLSGARTRARQGLFRALGLGSHHRFLSAGP